MKRLIIGFIILAAVAGGLLAAERLRRGVDRAQSQPFRSCNNGEPSLRDFAAVGFLAAETDGFEQRNERSANLAVATGTGAYLRVRQHIQRGTLPPASDVHIPEILNAWDSQDLTDGVTVLSVHFEAAPSPFSPGKHLLGVGITGGTRDTKVQLEFNPKAVRHHRHVGDEERATLNAAVRADAQAADFPDGRLVVGLFELELFPADPADTWVSVFAYTNNSEGTVGEDGVEITGEDFAPTFEDASEAFQYTAGVMGALEVWRDSAVSKTWSHERIESLVCATSESTECGTIESQARARFCRFWKKSRPLLDARAAVP